MATHRRHHSRRGGNRRKTQSGFILTIQDSRQRGEEYHFETEAVIGRIEENDIIIIDESISRHHAKVWGRRGVFLVEDLGSSNGTRLNGKIIVEPEVLKDGDYITVGTVNLMFSNLDINSSGDTTAIIHLTDKQKEKLDHETPEVSIKEKLNEMWGTKTGRYQIIGGGLVIAFIFLFLFKQMFSSDKKEVHKVVDYSDSVIEYDENRWESFLDNMYGNCNGCELHKTALKINFNVPVKNTRVILSYAAGMIEKDREVEILLNGKRIKYAEWAPPDHPKYNYVIDLYRAAKRNPKLKLKVGENLLEFRNVYNIKEPRKNEYWVVFYIHIKTKALPKANIERASNDYRNAKESFERRELNVENYKNALKLFGRVIDLLELADLDKPEMAKFKSMYKDSIRSINILNRELDHVFGTMRGYIQQVARMDDPVEIKKARYIINQDLKRFPDDDLRKKKLDSMIVEFFE